MDYLELAMLHDQRIFFSDNGTINDLSLNLNDFRNGTEVIDYVAAEDYIYIASFLPFNHKQFDVGVVNQTTTAVSVDIWDGSTWNAAVDVIDRTSSGGVSLAQDGVISWSTDIDKTWQRERESVDVTGLSTAPAVYDMYWVRLSWSADFTATMSLKFIGQKFSVDTDLYSYYPDLNSTSIQGAFESGKTDWNDQHYIAAQHIVRDLKKNDSLISADQIMDFDLFEETAVHAVAMIIYWGLGQFEMHDKAKAKYEDNLKLGFLNLDMNADGRLEPRERVIRQGFLTR